MEYPYFVWITYLAYLLLAVKIIGTPITLSEVRMFALAMVLGGCVYWQTSSPIVIVNVLFIIGAMNVDFHTTIRWCGVAMTASLSFVICASLLGFLPLGGSAGVVLGFMNPNGLQSIVLIISVYFLGESYQYSNLGAIGILLIINTVFGMLTGSRGGYGTVLFSIILIVVLKSHKGRISRLKVEKIFLILTIVTLLFVVTYNNNGLLEYVNRLLSGRLYQAHSYLQEYGIHCFGSNIVELGNDYLYWHNSLDCGYARLFINFGLIYGIVFVVLYYVALKRARLMQDGFAVVILMGIAIGLVVENAGIGVNYNMSLILLEPIIESFAKRKKPRIRLMASHIH
jgi:hypothetical protein